MVPDSLLDMTGEEIIDNEDIEEAGREQKEKKYMKAQYRILSFVINNGDKVHKYALGIFHEMLRSLAEDESENIIKNINELLYNLCHLPGDFTIPTIIFVTFHMPAS